MAMMLTLTRQLSSKKNTRQQWGAGHWSSKISHYNDKDNHDKNWWWRWCLLMSPGAIGIKTRMAKKDGMTPGTVWRRQWEVSLGDLEDNPDHAADVDCHSCYLLWLMMTRNNADWTGDEDYRQNRGSDWLWTAINLYEKQRPQPCKRCLKSYALRWCWCWKLKQMGWGHLYRGSKVDKVWFTGDRPHWHLLCASIIL